MDQPMELSPQARDAIEAMALDSVRKILAEATVQIQRQLACCVSDVTDLQRIAVQRMREDILK